MYVVIIFEVKRSLVLGMVQDAEVENVEKMFDYAEIIGVELDVEVDIELFQVCEVGPVIVDEIREWQVDLVVIGMPFRQRFGEFHMGKTAFYVLKFAFCWTLLFREPLQY